MNLKAEKMKVLQMVETGKISVTEGELLLDALGEGNGMEETAVLPLTKPTLTADALHQFSQAEVSPKFLQEASQLPLSHLTTDDITLLWEEEVDLAIVRALASSKLHTRLTMPQMIEIAHEGTQPALIAALADLNTPTLSAEQLVEIMIERLDPAVIQAIAALDLPTLDGQHLVELAAEKVEIDLLLAVGELTAVNLTGDHIVELASERVDPAVIRALASAKILNLTGDQVVEMASEGIDPALIKVWQDINIYDFA